MALGLRSTGVEVDSAGVITTPGVAFLARSRGYAAGVVISASKMGKFKMVAQVVTVGLLIPGFAVAMGWPLAGATASHPAGERCSSSAGSDPHHSPSATSTPHQSSFSAAIEDGRRHRPTCFVVKTFHMPLLILKNLSKA